MTGLVASAMPPVYNAFVLLGESTLINLMWGNKDVYAGGQYKFRSARTTGRGNN